MRYRAEAHHTDTRKLALELGEWETRREAQIACIGHVGQPLVWEERSLGFWQARTEGYWYQIIATRD